MSKEKFNNFKKELKALLQKYNYSIDNYGYACTFEECEFEINDLETRESCYLANGRHFDANDIIIEENNNE